MKWLFTSAALLAIPLYVFAASGIESDSTKAMPYQRGFQFEPGIYLTINDWKHNNPIPKEAIITEFDPGAPYFYLQVLHKRWLHYRDANGTVNKIECEKIFGYSVDNVVYTKHHLKIAIIGAICHFTSVLYQIDDPYLTGFAFAVMDISMSNQSGIHKQEKFRQYIINFETGAIHRFTERALKKLISTDIHLYQEYKQFKGRKRDRMFIFLKKYNERHPVYFAQADF